MPDTRPYTKELDLAACRHLAYALLLCACVDAIGHDEAWEWVQSPEAETWAQLAGIGHCWPPKRSQLAPKQELRWRANAEFAE